MTVTRMLTLAVPDRSCHRPSALVRHRYSWGGGSDLRAVLLMEVEQVMR